MKDTKQKQIRIFALVTAFSICNINCSGSLIPSSPQSRFSLQTMQNLFTKDALRSNLQKYVSEPFSKLDKKYQVGIGVLGLAAGTIAASYAIYKIGNSAHDRLFPFSAARQAITKEDTNKLRLAAQRIDWSEAGALLTSCRTHRDLLTVFEAKHNDDMGSTTFTFEQMCQIAFPESHVRLSTITDQRNGQVEHYTIVPTLYEALLKQDVINVLEWLFQNRAATCPYRLEKYNRAIKTMLDRSFSDEECAHAVRLLCLHMPRAFNADGTTKVHQKISDVFDALFPDEATFSENPGDQAARRRQVRGLKKQALKACARQFIASYNLGDSVAHLHNLTALCKEFFEVQDWFIFATLSRTSYPAGTFCETHIRVQVQSAEVFLYDLVKKCKTLKIRKQEIQPDCVIQDVLKSHYDEMRPPRVFIPYVELRDNSPQGKAYRHLCNHQQFIADYYSNITSMLPESYNDNPAASSQAASSSNESLSLQKHGVYSLPGILKDMIDNDQLSAQQQIDLLISLKIYDEERPNKLIPLLRDTKYDHKGTPVGPIRYSFIVAKEQGKEPILGKYLIDRLLEQYKDKPNAPKTYAHLARNAVVSGIIEYVGYVLSKPDYPKEDLPELLAFAAKRNASQEIINWIQRMQGEAEVTP